MILKILGLLRGPLGIVTNVIGRVGNLRFCGAVLLRGGPAGVSFCNALLKGVRAFLRALRVLGTVPIFAAVVPLNDIENIS